jgi:SAM-dependent methyltransferase
MPPEHDDTVLASFARQAAGFESRGLTLSQDDLLRWMVGHLPLRPYAEVLDVAAGTGILTRAMARYVHSVTAVDMKSDFGSGRVPAGISMLHFRSSRTFPDSAEYYSDRPV